MLTLLLAGAIILGTTTAIDTDSLAACTDEQVKYVYTPCDEHGSRWRVEVPKVSTCKLESPEQPTPGVNCSMQCQPGEYLNIESQKCEKCKQGEYSVGDGIRYATWDKLPEGFRTRGFSVSHRHKSDVDPCRAAVWEPRGDYLESNGSSCRSVLKFSVDLVKDGNVTFSVKAGAEDSFFHVWVEGSSHSYIDTSDPSNEMYYTLTSDWKQHTMELQRGHNTIYFVASYFSTNVFSPENNEDQSFESNSERTVMIKEIVVRGYAYSEKCEKCEAGTYSTPGASSCLPCKRDTFSNGGSGTCELCGSGEYSAPHSSKCLKKKPCTTSDYREAWEQCENMKTRKTYEWVLPKICSESDPKSVKLPSSGDYIPCPGCNPGFYSNGTDCLLCPKDTFNEDGTGECEKCGAGTRSVPGLHYKFWRDFPGGHIHLYCLAKPEDGCRSQIGWTTHDSYISSGIGHADDAEQLMYVIVPDGFTRKQSKFSLTYAIECPSETCRMRIQSIQAANDIHDITTVVGNVKKTTFVHTRHSAARTRYRIVFDKKYHPQRQTFKYSSARLLIYEIEVTNVQGGGAEKCERCSTAGGSESCIKCKPGEYIDNGRCVQCPKDTYLDSDNAVGITSCKKCPPYTVSSPGSTSCHSDCLLTLDQDREQKLRRRYNLTALSGVHMANGPEQFTTKGYNYHHSYLISICGHPFQESVCVNNASKGEKNVEETSVRGAVCRRTIIPDRDTVLSAQPISIGAKVLSVVAKSELEKDINTTDVTTAVAKVEDSNDIVFTFYSKRFTDVCKNGTSATVRLVCDPLMDGRGKMVIGDHGCNSETCDGCRYHFTLQSIHACTQCSEEDYQTIQGACKDGKKTLHYVWKENRVCIGGVSKPEDQTMECTIFEKSILDFKMVILGFLVFGIILAIIVLVLCYRNRSLSYKYSRLIDASQSKDGELPAAETCMYEEGEEEDEIILSRKGGSRPKILDRLKGMAGKKNDFSEFETINLDSMKEKDEFDDSDDGL